MPEHRYYVYILSGERGTLYIGVTNNIYVRTLQHRRGEVDGFTKRYSCHRLIYYEEFQFIQHAIAREKQLKHWSRKKKLELVRRENPRFLDIAENWGATLILPNQSTKAGN